MRFRQHDDFVTVVVDSLKVYTPHHPFSMLSQFSIRAVDLSVTHIPCCTFLAHIRFALGNALVSVQRTTQNPFLLHSHSSIRVVDLPATNTPRHLFFAHTLFTIASVLETVQRTPL